MMASDMAWTNKLGDAVLAQHQDVMDAVQRMRQKAKDSSIQLIMTTNDRFVMNQVPLEDWSVLQRQGSHVRVLNYANSRDLFEEFKFTGLSNFSFLETDFANGPQAAEVDVHE